jgi:acetolactate synthase I/II/III large subunit
MNAACDNVPILLAAGRTPITETGNVASRNRSIHWGQESFDQGAMVREFVKWDYELRGGQPVGAVVDRAIDIAMSEPRGPVYLTLPREVLAAQATHARRDNVRPMGVANPEPARRAIEEAAAMIAKAEFPLIVTSSIGRDPAAITELGKLADEFAIPVVQTEARDYNMASDHPMNLGFEAAAWIAKADLVIVLECVIPWIPKSGGPRRDAKIITISADPIPSCVYCSLSTNVRTAAISIPQPLNGKVSPGPSAGGARCASRRSKSISTARRQGQHHAAHRAATVTRFREGGGDVWGQGREGDNGGRSAPGTGAGS